MIVFSICGFQNSYIGSTRYETYVIGDLPKQLRSMEPLPGKTFFKMAPCNLCKGNMFLIQRALLYCISEYQAQFVVDWNGLIGFPYIVQETVVT